MRYLIALILIISLGGAIKAQHPKGDNASHYYQNAIGVDGSAVYVTREIVVYTSLLSYDSSEPISWVIDDMRKDYPNKKVVFTNDLWIDEVGRNIYYKISKIKY